MRTRTVRHLLILLVIAAVYISCGQSRMNANLQQLIGQPITLSESLQGVIEGRDTLAPAAKVLVYYNAEGCTPCKLKELLQWYNLKNELSDSLVEFIYILNTTNTTIPEITETIQTYHFDHPVFYDNLGDFERLNPGLPANPTFHTFLLDRSNRVVLVGSPIGNPKMWMLYKQTIAKLATNDGQLSAAVPLP